jgi:hypothetical protein
MVTAMTKQASHSLGNDNQIRGFDLNPLNLNLNPDPEFFVSLWIFFCARSSRVRIGRGIPKLVFIAKKCQNSNQLILIVSDIHTHTTRTHTTHNTPHNPKYTRERRRHFCRAAPVIRDSRARRASLLRFVASRRLSTRLSSSAPPKPSRASSRCVRRSAATKGPKERRRCHPGGRSPSSLPSRARMK